MKANEVWTSTLDDKYTVTVIRESPSRGVLTITEGEQVLYRESVGLMYDALFGPDIDDVASWQDIAVRFSDLSTAAINSSDRESREGSLTFSPFHSPPARIGKLRVVPSTGTHRPAILHPQLETHRLRPCVPFHRAAPAPFSRSQQHRKFLLPQDSEETSDGKANC